MRLVLLIIGAAVAQGRPAKFDEDDPQWKDDATDQEWFEEARKAGLQMDDNFAASYNGHASALSQAAISDRRRWRRAGAGRIVRVPLTSSPGPGPDATPQPHHRRHASRQATRQNWPFGGAVVRRGDDFHWEAPFHLRRRRAAAADVVVACLGDSITRGARDLNYPLLMQRDELGDAWRVANYGVSGASLKRGETGVGKPFVDEASYAAFTDDGADVVIILLGTNDALTGYIGGDDFADEAFKDAYKSMIDDIVAKTSPNAIFLGVPPPVFPTDYSSDWDIPTIDSLSEYIVQVKDWAADEHADVFFETIDFYDGLMGPDDEPDYYIKDGVHPYNRGYARMAEVAAASLREWRNAGDEPAATRRPTYQPTGRAATYEPTYQPTAPTCEDDSSWTYNAGEKGYKGCDHVAGKAEKRCRLRVSDDDVPAHEACKETCGSC